MKLLIKGRSVDIRESISTHDDIDYVRTCVEFEGAIKHTDGVKEWNGEDAWGEIYINDELYMLDFTPSKRYKVTVTIEEATDDER